MNKKITIEPVNADISMSATALQLKNGFMVLGFKTSSAFTSIVQYYLPEYSDDDQLKRLHNWWNGRLKDEKVNLAVETVLEQLKHE